jgi:hypothetical protein
MKKSELRTLLKKNRQVNRERLASILKLLAELRNQGVLFDNYGLEIPFSKSGLRRVRSDDSRAVHLR